MKLGEHDVVLDKYGNIIVIHDNTFVKHGSRIDHIEERFNEQDQNVEDLVKKQTLVDDEILNAQKEVNQLVLKSEQSVLEATKKAVEVNKNIRKGNMNTIVCISRCTTEYERSGHAVGTENGCNQENPRGSATADC